MHIILRFSETDQYGAIKRHGNAKKAALIVSRRPNCDRDWAVAVELASA